MLTWMREPCSVDIWFSKVVQNPQQSELKQTSLTFFRVHINNKQIIKTDEAMGYNCQQEK